MYNSQRFVFNSLYELESKVQNTKMKTQQNIDRIIIQKTAFMTNTQSMITHQSARLRSASVTVAPKYDQLRLRENTFRGHRSLRSRIRQPIQLSKFGSSMQLLSRYRYLTGSAVFLLGCYKLYTLGLSPRNSQISGCQRPLSAQLNQEQFHDIFSN